MIDNFSIFAILKSIDSSIIFTLSKLNVTASSDVNFKGVV